MAINPESQYPGKIAPSTAAYPYGQARNITVPGDGTGTPWEAALVNDLFGMQQALLSAASVVPSGTPDQVGTSQYLEALAKAISDLTKIRFDGVDAMVTGIAIGGQSVAYAEGMKLNTGLTDWKVVTASGSDRVAIAGGLYALPLNGVWVDDFIADRSVNATSEFEDAIGLGRHVKLTAGDYFVNDITVNSNLTMSGPRSAVMRVDTASAAVFLADTSAGDKTNVRIEGFTARASSALTGCAFWRQNNKTNYCAYAQFTDIETWNDFEITYDGYFIFTVWRACRDGYSGTAPGGQTHQFINSVPNAFGQSKQTNLNRVENCKVFRSDDANAAVDIAYGVNWVFKGNDFENCDTRAIRARGIYSLTIEENWFEDCDADELVYADLSPAPNAQGSRPVVFAKNHCFMNANNLRALYKGGATQYSVIDNSFANVPVGCTLANVTEFNEYYGNQVISGAGAADFFTDCVATRSSLQVSSSEMTSGVINSPQTTNQNVFPLGPSGLGSANFTASGFIGKTDVASALGLAGQAIQVTASGGANSLSYEIPAKLRDFLEGKTVTIVAVGWGDSSGGVTGVSAAVWEDVTPTGSNQTANGGTINTSLENLQVAYVTHTIGSGLTSLHFGVRAGGVASFPDVKLEAFAVYLGEIKPEGINFN